MLFERRITRPYHYVACRGGPLLESTFFETYSLRYRWSVVIVVRTIAAAARLWVFSMIGCGKSRHGTPAPLLIRQLPPAGILMLIWHFGLNLDCTFSSPIPMVGTSAFYQFSPAFAKSHSAKCISSNLNELA